MTSLNNRDFYRRRAAQAFALADAAKTPAIRRIHRDMAAHYTILAGSIADSSAVLPDRRPSACSASAETLAPVA